MTAEKNDVVLSGNDATRIRSAIYRTLEKHGADYQVLSVFGSLFDTLEIGDVLDAAEGWLDTGEIMRPVSFQ